jgi:WD40 repeat protein
MICSRLKVGAALLALAAGSTLAGVTVPGQTPQKQSSAVRVDMYGDPLPGGAVARLGSIQLRHLNLTSVAFSADGKSVLSLGADQVKFWDVASGKLIRTVQLDGKLSDGVRSSTRRGQDIVSIHVPALAPVISPNGKLIAACCDDSTFVWDAITGKQLKHLSDLNIFGSAVFSEDGNVLVVANPDFTEFSCCTWASGKQIKVSIPRPDPMHRVDSTSHLAMSPDGKLLAVGPSSQESLGVWDLSTRKMRFSLDVGPGASRFSPDNKRLVVTCMENKGAGDKTDLLLVDVVSGQQIKQTPLPGKGFYSRLLFSADGRWIAAVSTDGIHLLDSTTLQEQRQVGSWESGRQTSAVFAPNGHILASWGQSQKEWGSNQIHLWDADTGRELQQRPAPGPATGLAYSPDGKQVACGPWLEPTLGIWDPATGQRLRLLKSRELGYVRHLEFAADRQSLVVGRYDGVLDWIDATTGHTQRSIAFDDLRMVKSTFDAFSFYSVSSDGQRAITVEGGPMGPDASLVSMWEIGAAKRLIATQEIASVGARVKSHMASLGHQAAILIDKGLLHADTVGTFRLLTSGAWDEPLVASPDHGLLAAQEIEKPTGVNPRKDPDPPLAWVHVWEADTGSKIVSLSGCQINHMGFGDSRTLVTVGPAALIVWDLPTGKARHRIEFPKDFSSHTKHFTSYVRGFCLSPDGGQALTPLQDGTALVWELPPRAPPVLNPLGHADASRLWTDLAASEASTAYGALWKLTDTPDAAVALLGKNLKPLATAQAERIRDLMKELDGDKFAMREAATAKLAKLGRAVLPALRQALAGKPSLERRSRIEKLLPKVSDVPLDQETLRRLRAVYALEAIGTAEARRLLQGLAEGPAMPETEQAKAALDRLARRQ